MSEDVKWPRVRREPIHHSRRHCGHYNSGKKTYDDY